MQQVQGITQVDGIAVQPVHRASCHCGAVQLDVKLPNGIVDPRRCDCSYCRRRGTVVALLFGAYVLADGLIGLLNAIGGNGERSRSNRWLLALWGVLSIIVGVLTFIEPMRTALVLILLMAWWAILIGLVQLVTAWRLRKAMPGEWLLAGLGVLSLVFGIGLLLAPGAGAIGMLWLVAVYALVAGGLMVLLAFKLRRIGKRGLPA